MGLLQNAAIERPEKMFLVEMVVFGTKTRDAARRTVKVLAETAKGARKICKRRYRRSEIRSARMLDAGVHMVSMDLFSTTFS